MPESLTLLKKRLVQLFSCEFSQISKNTFYYKIPLVAASDSLKPFLFEPKTNIGDINSSSDDKEEGESKRDNSMVTVSGASAVQKQSLEDVLQNRCQPCNFIKKILQHRCFPMKFKKSLRTPFFTEHLCSDGCFSQ